MNSKNKFRLLSLFFIVSIAVSFFSASKDEEPRIPKNISFEGFENIANEKPGILEIDITGPIFFTINQDFFNSQSGVKHWKSLIDKSAKDDLVKGLFLRINSPGGSVAASQELFESVKRFQKTGKPIVVSVKDILASGSYYAALPANVIIANPGSIVGSIGVIIETADLSELYEKIGVDVDTVKSGPYKDMFSTSRPKTAEEQAMLQKIVDEMHSQFVREVNTWRASKAGSDSLEDFATGQIFTATEAREIGLIDAIGDREFALEKLADLSGLDYEDLHLIQYGRYQRFKDFFQIDTLIKHHISDALSIAIKNSLQEVLEGNKISPVK